MAHYSSKYDFSVYSSKIVLSFLYQYYLCDQQLLCFLFFTCIFLCNHSSGINLVVMPAKAQHEGAFGDNTGSLLFNLPENISCDSSSILSQQDSSEGSYNMFLRRNMKKKILSLYLILSLIHSSAEL